MQELKEYGGLAVGDWVRVPGHGRRDPSSEGVLKTIEVVQYARGRGIFAEVEIGEGRTVCTAIGLVTKVAR